MARPTRKQIVKALQDLREAALKSCDKATRRSSAVDNATDILGRECGWIDVPIL